MLRDLFLGPLRSARLVRWHRVYGIAPVDTGSIPVQAFVFTRVVILSKFCTYTSIEANLGCRARDRCYVSLAAFLSALYLLVGSAFYC